MDDERGQQEAREKGQRDAALGKRAKAVLRGDLGPILKRWVSGSVLPVSDRLRDYIHLRACGNRVQASQLLHSPLFGMSSTAEGGDSKALDSVLAWFLKPGIGDDLVLAVMGTTITTLANASDKPVPLTRLLFAAGEAARETTLGQFLTQVQGAKAMLKVRSSGKASWAQKKGMDRVADMLTSQVRPQFLGDQEAIDLGEGARGKMVVGVITQKGDERRIDLRPPTTADWKLLEVTQRPKGEADSHRATWASFAMLVLVAAQAEAGWWDIAEITPVGFSETYRRSKRRSKAKGLVLSRPAYEAIKQDLDKWLKMGFVREPMVTEPVEGDYLTVKHRPVAGGRGPMGHKTQAKDSAAWHVAGEVMAKTPWNVHTPLLKAIQESEFVQSLVAKDFPDEVRRETVLNGYRQFAPGQALYMPLYMDFRGRVYTQPSVVTYQGKDLQKALLVFPETRHSPRNIMAGSPALDAVIAHISALYGGPEKLDKASMSDRREWFHDMGCSTTLAFGSMGRFDRAGVQDFLAKADEPLQLITAMSLPGPYTTDQMACQIDGTCNGLQHLSALFRDETAAPFVNLVGGATVPADIYAEVARRVVARLDGIQDPWAHRLQAAVRVDRKLCKSPVMVLPYGGTRGTIEEAVLEAILGQEPIPRWWLEGYAGDNYFPTNYGSGVDHNMWPDWDAGNYVAFRERELKDHPLLHSDAKKLGGVVWECIGEVIPKAMLAMQAFRNIAKTVGNRTLEWDTGFHTQEHDALWVTEAKAKSERSTLKFKGLHLPASVRGLSMRQGRDEVDSGSHTSGIVANFIHSQDASHLARTMGRFGMPAFGAIHDCFITRPSLMAKLKADTRRAFREQYLMDPLSRPVMMFEPGEKKGYGYASWYELAKDCGVEFPEDGTWEPSEVMGSEWFFS